MTEAAAQHPLASQHLPFFITPPGETDTLLYVVAIVVAVIILMIGAFYFKLHAVPEQMAHRMEKAQFEVVSVLALIALFTHNHLFWIAALLLALVPIPDFSTPLRGIAASLARLADAEQPARAKSVLPAPEIVVSPPPQLPAGQDGQAPVATVAGRQSHV